MIFLAGALNKAGMLNAMTCVSLHGGAGFSYARETRAIVAALLFCVDGEDCMTVLSGHNSSSKGDCFELI